MDKKRYPESLSIFVDMRYNAAESCRDSERRALMNTKEIMRPIKAGKVREIYDCGNTLVLVATDRLSAFDVILKSPIPGRGRILTQMSAFWFNFTRDITGNHMLSTDTKDMPAFFQTEEFEGRAMLCKKLRMLPIECIVRGYITGSGYQSYLQTGEVCGIRLPDGLRECEKLPAPIYTPSTKAELGTHDENISFDQSAEVLEREFPGQGAALAKTISDAAVNIYMKCAEYARSRGIIIADTKLEFGLDETGTVVLGDELLTPDSSRFWPMEGYEPGHGQPSYDKQFVRDYLKENPAADGYLPQEIVDKTVEKYSEAYRLLTEA